MKNILKIAFAIVLFGAIVFIVSSKRSQENEVIIKVKAAKSASYSTQIVNNDCYSV